jgi:hypothetical protein
VPVACCLARLTRFGQVHVERSFCSSASICTGLTRASVLRGTRERVGPRADTLAANDRVEAEARIDERRPILRSPQRVCRPGLSPHQRQREHEADLNASPGETDQWRALLQLLATETTCPEDCYFALWDGWRFPESARQWPTGGVPHGARIPARSFFLFRGPLPEAEIWGTPAQAGIWGRPEFSQGGTPAFVWPSDHTWCVAADIDPHWSRDRSDRAVDRAAHRGSPPQRRRSCPRRRGARLPITTSRLRRLE